MTRKYFTIGDIHGCVRELDLLVERLVTTQGLEADDALIFLGDYVDRGPNSAEVIDFLLALKKDFQCHFLMGNHEILFLRHLDAAGSPEEDIWLQCGGLATLSSYSRRLYGTDKPLRIHREDMPPDHLEFLESAEPYFELRIDGHIHFFTHAQPPPLLTSLLEVRGLLREDPFQNPLFWGKERPSDALRLPNVTFYSGHTPQREVFDDGQTVFMDTGCCYGKTLSALEINSRTIIQVGAGEYHSKPA